MRRRWIDAALAAGLAMTLAGSLAAQQRQTSPLQPSIMDEEQPDQDTTPAPPPAKPARHAQTPPAALAAGPDPNLDAEDQLAPSQMAQPMPAAVPTPTANPSHATAHPAKQTATAKPSLHAVACSGPFAKDSSNLTLAMAFDSRNVVFTDVDVSGSKVAASILFPKDPKRRLEIWWSNPANRTTIYLIVINGQSTWTAPGSMRLGLTLAELEKLNHKPFKLKGFNKDNIATVSDWDGGALATLPGGCKSGLSLKADPKAPADAVSALPADHDYTSADPAMRAVKPTVSEILIGY